MSLKQEPAGLTSCAITKGLFGMLSIKNNLTGSFVKRCSRCRLHTLGTLFNLGKSQLHKRSIVYLAVRTLIIGSLLSFFTTDLQSMMVARQKQKFVTLLKRHPIVSSAVAVGCAAWLGHAIMKCYRKKQRQIPCNLEGNPVVQQVSEKSNEKKATVNPELEEAFSIVSHYIGTGESANIPKAVTILQRFAEQGDAEAQWGFGICYSNGIGVKKDVVKAFKFFKTAAEKGNAKAQSDVGKCYKHGVGVKQDDDKAFEFLKLLLSKDMSSPKTL